MNYQILRRTGTLLAMALGVSLLASCGSPFTSRSHPSDDKLAQLFSPTPSSVSQANGKTQIVYHAVLLEREKTTGFAFSRAIREELGDQVTVLPSKTSASYVISGHQPQTEKSLGRLFSGYSKITSTVVAAKVGGRATLLDTSFGTDKADDLLKDGFHTADSFYAEIYGREQGNNLHLTGGLLHIS